MPLILNIFYSVAFESINQTLDKSYSLSFDISQLLRVQLSVEVRSLQASLQEPLKQFLRKVGIYLVTFHLERNFVEVF